MSSPCAGLMDPVLIPQHWTLGWVKQLFGLGLDLSQGDPGWLQLLQVKWKQKCVS